MRSVPSSLRSRSFADLLAKPLPGPIRLFLLLEALLAGVCGAAELFCHFALHLNAREYLTPLFVGQRFFDFECYRTDFQHLHTAAFFSLHQTFPFAYPAPAAVLLAVFYSAPGDPLNFYLGVVSLLTVVTAALFGRALSRRGLALRSAVGVPVAMLLLSYPFFFAFERANLEFMTFFILALGTWAFVKERTYWAAICYGLAGSLKIFPILYLLLLFSRKRYREFAVGMGTAALANLLALWFVGPTISMAYHGIEAGMANFRQWFLLHARPAEFGYDHSLNGFYRRFMTLPAPEVVAHELNIYMAVAAIAGGALYLFYLRRLPILNQVLCLAVIAILVPPVSFDYTLIHLYVPLGLLMLFAIEQQGRGAAFASIKGFKPILVCFALLMAPESELILHGVRLGSQLKCLVLMALLALGLRYPITATESVEPADQNPEPVESGEESGPGVSQPALVAD